MIKKIFLSELEGQTDFYKTFIPLIDKTIDLNDIIIENTDGIINGNLIEFKLHITDLNSALNQAIKYLSNMRTKGKTLPANIVLISLNEQLGYVYNANDYLKDIEKQYIYSASIKEGYISNSEPLEVVDYSTDKGFYRLRDILRENDTCKYNVDENNVVGLAKRYYKNVPSATKISLLGDGQGVVGNLGEIRNPSYFKDTIYPYKEETNEKMAYLMDALNPNFMQKDLGAFYTPPIYAKKAHELVYDAIRRHQQSGNKDYIIIDRAAGTGNLQEGLNDNVPDDIVDKDVLSHVILNTYEYLEYKVLHEKLGDKVRAIIPPAEDKETFQNGFVKGSDALSKEFCENDAIMQYINDDEVTVIVYENPPYSQYNALHNQNKQNHLKDTYVSKMAKKELTNGYHNDIMNLFVWSAINLYLRKPEDSLVLFAPIKYWQNGDWFNLTMDKGFLSNKAKFNAGTPSAVSCILWHNKPSDKRQFLLPALNIVNNDILQEAVVKLNKSNESYTMNVKEFNYNRGDNYIYRKDEKDGVWCSNDGKRYVGSKPSTSTIVGSNKKIDNYIGFVMLSGKMFNSPRLRTNLTLFPVYNTNGVNLRTHNYYAFLPLFAAGWFTTYNPEWYNLDTYTRTISINNFKEFYNKAVKKSDKDINNFLNRLVFYTSLEYYTKIRSQKVNNIIYYNELSLDNNICHDSVEDDYLKEAGNTTLAYHALKYNGFFDNMNEIESEMYHLWAKILKQAKETDNYNEKLNYGIYQIDEELNTSYKVKTGRSIKTVYNYPQLNEDLKLMRGLIKKYYNKYILNDLFMYGFIK